MAQRRKAAPGRFAADPWGVEPWAGLGFVGLGSDQGVKTLLPKLRIPRAM